MNEIILSTQNGEPVASSREVAKRFGKEHKHVLAAIRQILAAENSATKFFHETAFEYRGQRFPEYLMNRDGFSLLAMGFTGKEAVQWKLKYIDDTKDADTDEYHAAEGRNPAGVNKPQKQPAQKREAPAPKREAPAPKSQPVQEKSFVCACCGKPLQPVTYKGRTVEPAETAASTKKKFGRVLCWTCAQKQPKED